MICLYIGGARVEDRKKTRRRRRRRRYLSIWKNICDPVCVIYLYYNFIRLSIAYAYLYDPISFGFIGRPFIISTVLYIPVYDDNNTRVEYTYIVGIYIYIWYNIYKDSTRLHIERYISIFFLAPIGGTGIPI